LPRFGSVFIGNEIRIDPDHRRFILKLKLKFDCARYVLRPLGVLFSPIRVSAVRIHKGT
jgi:hypothetical protein